MPVYKYNGTTYDIPEDVVSDFEKDMPEATLAYQVDGTVYDIPVSEKKGFLDTYPNASLYGEEVAQPAPSAREQLQAFYQENGAFLDDFEKRDSADSKLSAAESMDGGFSLFGAKKNNSLVTDEERKQYGVLDAQRKQLEKAWYTSDEYLSQKNATALELGQMRDDIHNSKKAYVESQPQIKMSGLENAVMEGKTMGDYESQQFDIAARIMDKTIKLHNAPSKYDSNSGLKNMGIGAADKATDPALLSAGLTEITDNVGARVVLQKVQKELGNLNDLSEERIEKILSPAEKAVLRSWAMYAQEQLNRQGDLSLGYQAGQGTVESLAFMAEFALTGGVGKAASEGAETLAKWLGKKWYGLKGLGDEAAEAVMKAAGEKTLGKYGQKLGLALAETAGRTLVMPSTYRNISEKATEIEEDEDGNRYLIGLNDAFIKGYADSFIENLSEGGRVNALGELVGDIAGNIPAWKKMVNAFSNTKASELLKRLNSTCMMNTLRAGGWHGFGEEYLEEWYGNALRTITGVDKNALKDFATLDNQMVTLASFLPITIFGGTVSTGQVISAKRDLDKKAEALQSALMGRGYDEAQAKNMIDMMRAETPQGISNLITPLIRRVAGANENEARELAKPAMEFAWAVQRYQSYDTKYSYQQQEQRDNLKADMEAKLGKFWMEGEDGQQTVQRGVNEKGEVVYLLGKKDIEETAEGIGAEKEVAAIDAEGNHIFVFPSDYRLEEELPMNDFLGIEIMTQKRDSEAVRMASERDAKFAEVKSRSRLGTQLNIGTNEAPVVATISKVDADGVVVETPEGFRKITYTELANKYADINPAVYTDAELDEQEADNISAERAQREATLDQEYENDDDAIEELAEAESEIEQSVEEATKLPLKDDGTVDQAALWNESPARWAKWNDEQKQDGGADTLAYLNTAIKAQTAKIEQLVAAQEAETDFDRRDAIAAELSEARMRQGDLLALHGQYTAQVEAQAIQQQAAQPVQPAPQLTEEEKAALEEERRKPLRAKAKELSEKLGVKVKIAEDLSDVKESKAREQLLKSVVSNGKQKVAGWYNQATGEVTIYLPHAESVEDVEKTFIHEVVAHKGLRGLLGEEGFNVLCDAVWDMMSEGDRMRFINYPGVNGDKRAAADEYMAHFAENLNLEEAKPDMWERIVAIIKQILDSMGVRLRINQEGLSSVIAASYQKLVADAKAAQGVSAEAVTETATETIAEEPQTGGAEVISEEQLNAPNSGVAQQIIASDGEVLADTNGKGGVRFSIRTWEEGGRDYLASWLANDQVLAEDEKADILARMDEFYKNALLYSDTYVPFGTWSDAEVRYDNNGNPLMSVVKANGDYAMNLDFSLVCKKRRPLNRLLRTLINRNAFGSYDLKEREIAEINWILQEHGFEVACALCFVDSKRYRVAGVADVFAKLWNNLVTSLAPKGVQIAHFNYNGNPNVEPVENGLDTLPDDQLNWKKLDKAIANFKKGSVEYKVAQYLREHPEARKLVDATDFIEAEGFEAVKEANPDLLKFYNMKKGTGGPKASFGDVQYLNDILKSGKKFDAEKAYAVGGVRLQSFSDFVPHMYFDYMQLFAELAAKKLPVHAYTKETLFAKIFGLTGAKINLSLVPAVVEDGIAPGLDAEGNYAWADPVVDTEGNVIQQGQTFPYDEAMDIQRAEGYSKNCGAIAVGISDAHIEKMLDDPNIPFIIPYHKSSLNAIVARMTNIDQYKDYTNVQNTRKASGSKLDKSIKDFNFNEYLHGLGESGTPQMAAQAYLDWCRENKFIPKFSQFAYHPNYYKLLQDFNTIDLTTGEYAPQGAVTMTFPSEQNAFGNVEALIQQGLQEDAALEEKMEQEIDGIADQVVARLEEIAKEPKMSDKQRVKKMAELADERMAKIKEQSGVIDLVEEAKKAQAKHDAKEKKGKKSDVSFRITPEQDKAYMDAVEAGDMETAQRMVDEAAKAAGYTEKVLHGTQNFGFTRIEANKADDNLSFFATDDERVAHTYSSVYNTRKINADADYSVIDEIEAELEERAREEAYDLADSISSFAGYYGFIDGSYIHDTFKELSENYSSEEADNRMYEFADDAIYNAYDRDSYEGKEFADWQESDEAQELYTVVNQTIQAYISYARFKDNSEDSGNYDLYANVEDFFVIDGKGQNWSNIQSEQLPDITSEEYQKYGYRGHRDRWTTRSVSRYAHDLGYKGVLFKDIVDDGGRGTSKLYSAANVYSFFYPQQQVKSADPVTYDDAGNVIPLSERFNPENEDIRFRVIDTTKAELKDKPIKLNGMYRFNLKNVFKGVKDNGGSYPYIKVQLEEVPEDFAGEKITYNGILEGFAVVRIPKGLIIEGEKDNEFFIDPKAIEKELWDVLRATENYYEFKHGNAPYQRDWLNADEVRFRIANENQAIFVSNAAKAVEGIKMEDIELPNLEEAGRVMHSVPVTEEMKASVMEGQVMFRMRGANETPMEFTQKEVDNFVKRFYDVAPIYVVDKFSSKAELAKAIEMDEQYITDEQYQEILDGYNGNGKAFYSADWSLIITFAKSDNSADIENNLFHESVHKVDLEDIPGGGKLGQWFWDNADSIQDASKIKDAIENAPEYSEEDYAREMLAELLAWYMSIGETEILINQLPSEYQKTVKSILSEIRYDSREEDNLRQQPETTYSRAKDAIRKGTKEYGGKRENAKSNELSAEERRIIGEYFPEFNKSEDVRMRVNSQGKELTEGQREFFANSKAVDKDGNLLVLYHGTPRAGFTEFESGWFTTSKEDAISYSGDRKGRLFDPNEKYEPETLTAGDYRLGYMTFDSEEDRAEFLERFPYADEVMSEREYEDARMGAEDEEYDALTARRKEFAEVWNAYREYERERFVDTTIGDLIANPEAYTEEDLMRAMLEYDSNATFDSLDDMSAEERKDALVSALQTANEETEGGILDMVIPTRVPRNGEGVKHNDLGNRTYEVYANVENPYEIDANGRGSEFESGDIYKSVEEALADEQYDGVIIRNWRVGRTQQLGDVVVPKDGSQIKLTSNENPTESEDVRYRITPEVREEMKTIKEQAEKDGTFMNAPNGLRSNLTEEQWLMVRTKGFKEWFGDWINDPENASKVVDPETGEPMVVYHGTNKEFYEFRTRGVWDDGIIGVHFGTKEQAERVKGPQGQNIIMPVFLNIRNPYRVKDQIKREGSGRLDGWDMAVIKAKYGRYDGQNGQPADGLVYINEYEGKGDSYVVWEKNQIKSATDNTGEFSKESSDIRFRTSLELDEEFGDAWRNQQNEDGRHSTQVANTKSTYEKIGHYLEDAGMKGASILDASSGLGLGTQALREMGFQVDDVEPFPSENREAPTFSSYADIDGKYDVVISNAVLNVIPDDWRAEVLHQMADAVKEGGKMIINTRPASNIAQQGVEGKTRITLDSPSEILVKRGDRIAAYQKGFTSEELAEWIKSELGEGWRVEKATKKNSGISGEGTAVVIKEGDNVSFRTTGTPTDEVVANGVDLTPSQTSEVAANIFAALPEESRKKITEGLNGNILGLKDAILQIPASLASKENWNDEDRAMADIVAEEMTKMAGEMTRPFSAPEALWLLYNNLNKSTDLVSLAQRSLVQRNLGFDAQTLAVENEAKESLRFRQVGDARINATAGLYNKGAVNVMTRLKESFVDMNASVEELVKAIEERTGKKAEGFENILWALNQQSSRGLAAMEDYERRFLNPMYDAIRNIMDKAYAGYATVVRHVILKHGLERNKKLAQRDAKAHYQEIYEEMIAKVNSMDDRQKRTHLTNAQLQDADAKAKLATLKAADTSAFTEEEKNAHKRELAKAKEEVKKAKENLERAQKINSMSEQELKDELDRVFEKIENGTDSVYKELRKNDYSGISSMFYDQLGVNRKDYSTEEEYQAALMLAKNDRFSSLEEVEAQAEGEVESFEGRVDTKELWKRINAATKETLRQQYEANMISKDQYESLRDMFEYYVPLRGFKDNTAEDMYTYYRKPNSTGYTKPILGAEGRKTEAESPFGWIASMAGSAIASNVKNEAKLALFYFVSNRQDNGVATISKTWYVHTPGDVDERGKKIFKPVYPPFSEDLSSDAAKAQYEQWQDDMRKLKEQGLAYEAGQRLNLGNAVVNISDANKPEHIVAVKVGGKEYTIVINGNPRAAQAINGELNLEGTADDYSALFGPVLRWMSSVNTSYNPEFWITNMMRDMAFTWMAVNTKEADNKEYRRKFSKNYRKAFKVISLVAKNEKGTLGNSPIEQAYKDFVENGGVTGYTQIKDNETWEKEIDQYLRSNSPESLKSGKMMRGMKTVFHAAHRFGESLEQVSRFAAFLTAQEMGKSINEAINDAKEITVNFNRKGSGKMISLEEAKHLTDKNGRPLSKPKQWMVVGLSSIAPLGRRFIMFFNAAIQGLNATYKLWKANPKRFKGWVMGYFAVGAMNAILHAMMDDDDDYLDMPQYERRNALMIGGNGAYLKWALPQEARAFYALGDIVVESMLGRNPQKFWQKGGEVGQILTTIGEVLPINPTEGWRAVAPSIAIPALELMINEDYKGEAIYNDSKWLSKEEASRTANWNTAKSGTGWVHVKIAQGLNFLTGGDKYDAGLINIRPEAIEHLVQSAFGGTIRTADKFITTISAAIDPEEDVTVSQTPFLNRVLTLNDQRYRNVHVNEVFDYYAAEAEHAKTLEKKYRKDGDSDALLDLTSSDEYKWMMIYENYKKPLENVRERLKVAEGTRERKQIMREQDELKKMMIKQISNL